MVGWLQNEKGRFIFPFMNFVLGNLRNIQKRFGFAHGENFKRNAMEHLSHVMIASFSL
jgi:hypothetical protein